MTALPSTGFVGRAGELHSLSDALARALDGDGRVVVVSGEGGIGKTRLCEEGAMLARAKGFAVAWASCWEARVLPPLWPWHQLVEQLGIAWEPPAEGESAPDVARARQLSNLFEALRDAAARRPWLVVIDDAQWADAETLRLLTHLAPFIRSLRGVALVSAREREQGAVLPADLVRQSGTLPLRGLTLEELRALSGQLTGPTAPAGFDTELHRVTRGNPLFATELVRVLAQSGDLEQLVGGTGYSVPPTVRAVLDERLAQISPACRELLAVAAVAATEFAPWLLTAAAAQGPADVLAMLSEAVANRVVAEVGPSRFRFAHPLFRSVLYDDLGVARRTELHARIGETLESANPSGAANRTRLAALSYHFLLAASAGTGAKAARYAEGAAEAAWAGVAYEEAAGLYGRALEADELSPGSADRVQLLLGRARALAAAGDATAARDVFLAAGEQARHERRPDRFAEAALGLAGTGFEVALFDHQQVAMLEQAHDTPGANEALAAHVAARLSVALSLADDEPRRAALSAEAVQLADRSGDALARCQALAARCDIRAGPEHRAHRERDAAQIIRLAHERGDQGTELLGRRLLLVAALENGDLTAVDGEIHAFAQVADALRQPTYQWYANLWRATRAIAAGNVAEYHTSAADAERLGRAAGSVNCDILTMAQRWFALLELGDTAAACAELDLRIPPGRYSEMGPQMLPVEVARRLYSARQAEARAVFDAGIEAVLAAPHDAEWLTMVAQTADLACGLGASEWLDPLYNTLAPFAELWSVDGIAAYAHGPVHRQLGVLAAALGRDDPADAHFDAALAGNERVGADLLAARTQLDRAVATGDRGALRDARDRYRTLGIDARVSNIDQVLGDATRRADDARASPGAASPSEAVCRNEGDVWEVVYAGRSARVRDAKGMRDLATLLQQPGREFPALDLASHGPPREGDLGPQLDATAREAYKRRLTELEAELDHADTSGDAVRSGRLEVERDALIAQLSAAYGLGGRRRRAGDPAERARTAVTARIRDAIRRIGESHPELARHLTRSVRTGTFCAYDPEEEVRWIVDDSRRAR